MTFPAFAVAALIALLPVLVALAVASVLARRGVWRLRLVDRAGRTLAVLVLAGGDRAPRPPPEFPM